MRQRQAPSLDSRDVLLFMGPEDLRHSKGKIRFRPEALQPVEGLRHPPDIVVQAVYPTARGCGHDVYGTRMSNGTWQLLRYRTTNFVDYAGPDRVLDQPDDGAQIAWLNHVGFSLARRGRSREMLLKAKARAAPLHGLHFFRTVDGTHWTPTTGCEPAYTDHDAGTLVWCEEKDTFVALQTTYQPWAKPYEDNIGADKRRVLSVRTSRDGATWRPAMNVGFHGPFLPDSRLLTPDADDPAEMAFYCFAAFRYHDRYVGMMLNYAPSPLIVTPRMQDPTPSKHGPTLSTEWWVNRKSPDNLRAWQRPYRDTIAMPADISAGIGIRHGPALFGNAMLWFDHGFNKPELTSCAVLGLPIDRVAGAWSLANAEFSTRAFVASTRPLWLNAKALYRGPKVLHTQQAAYIMVEVLDANGRTIKGFEREHCILRDVDGVRLPLRWNRKSTASLRGRGIALRFFFRDATIYAAGW